MRLPCTLLLAQIAIALSPSYSSAQSPSATAPKPLAESVQDNSFFVEEAYNQEAGVVQHIFTGFGSINRLGGPDDREWALSFTQEWPVISQAHQFSYTVPYGFVETGGTTENGVGDILLNYRFQALFETDARPAISPRFSLVLPTGDEDDGFGNNNLGYQINLPVSKVLGNRLTAHFNAGATLFPDVRGEQLTTYNVGASVIYAVSENWNLMLEAVATSEEEPSDGGGTDREFSALLAPGMRYAFNFPDDSQVVLGVAAPIGLTGAAPDYGIFLYLSIEHSFIRPHDGSPLAPRSK